MTAAIFRDPSQGFQGADPSHRALMYAPTTLDPGSSVSHWDTSAFPNLLMEPIINADLTHSLDLTVPPSGTSDGPLGRRDAVAAATADCAALAVRCRRRRWRRCEQERLHQRARSADAVARAPRAPGLRRGGGGPG